MKLTAISVLVIVSATNGCNHDNRTITVTPYGSNKVACDKDAKALDGSINVTAACLPLDDLQ